MSAFDLCVLERWVVIRYPSSAPATEPKAPRYGLEGSFSQPRGHTFTHVSLYNPTKTQISDQFYPDYPQYGWEALWYDAQLPTRVWQVQSVVCVHPCVGVGRWSSLFVPVSVSPPGRATIAPTKLGETISMKALPILAAVTFAALVTLSACKDSEGTEPCEGETCSGHGDVSSRRPRTPPIASARIATTLGD